MKLFEILFRRLFGGGLGASPVTSGDIGDIDRSEESRRVSLVDIRPAKPGFSLSHWSNLAVSIFSSVGVFGRVGASTTVTSGTSTPSDGGDDTLDTSSSIDNGGEGVSERSS